MRFYGNAPFVSRPIRSHPFIRLLLLVVLALPGGCARLVYDRIALGAPPAEFDQSLTAADTRQTALGRSSFTQRTPRQADAIVLLLGPDRRVAGKLWAGRRSQDWRLGGGESLTLRGLIQRERYGVGQVSAVDALRLLWRDLYEAGGEARVEQCHGLIGVGLERLLANLDQAGAAQAARELADEDAPHSAWSAARVMLPPGGTTVLDDAGGYLSFTFTSRAGPTTQATPAAPGGEPPPDEAARDATETPE